MTTAQHIAAWWNSVPAHQRRRMLGLRYHDAAQLRFQRLEAAHMRRVILLYAGEATAQSATPVRRKA